MICLDCNNCKGKPPLLNQKSSPEEIQKRIVAQIENIVRQQNAKTLNLNLLDYFDWRLLEIYRDEEANQERKFRIQTHLIFEAMSKRENG